MEGSVFIGADGEVGSTSSVVEMEEQKMKEHSALLSFDISECDRAPSGVRFCQHGDEMQLPCQTAFPRSNQNSPAVGGDKLMGKGSTTMGSDGKACSFCWVIEMEEEIKNFDPSVEEATKRKQSIYRVPQVIKDETNSKAYQPRFVSLGPLHHGKHHLLPMEEIKHRAVLHMVSREQRPLWQFVAEILKVADELEGAYDGLDDNWRGSNRGKFVQVMVTDGCFLLELLRLHELYMEGELYKEDESNPVFYCFFKFRPQITQDMIRIENQLPLKVLERLRFVQRRESLSANTNKINNMVERFLPSPFNDVRKKNEEKASPAKLGLHILDIFHKSYFGACPGRGQSGDIQPARTPCAVELSEAGIQFKNTDTGNIHDIDFKNGFLSMPKLMMYDGTEIQLLNLMAFESLHHHDESTVSFYVSFYVSFMDKIIESERDVALLRSEGVLENMTGRDKVVVEMFNTLTRLARSPAKGSILGDVQGKVNSHRTKRRNKWRASFVRTYLSNPWVFISLVAATILLVATLLQTAYTIVPFYTKG